MGSKQRSLEREQLLELKKQLEKESSEKVKIKQMTYLNGVNLILNNSEQAILVEKELENKLKEYELYKVEGERFTKIAEYDREQNKLILEQEYVKEELEKAKIEQDIEVKLSPEELKDRASEIEELEETNKTVLGENGIKQEEMDQDEIETYAIQKGIGIELSKCYKIEDENYASDVLGRETGEDHYIGIEKKTGRYIAISGSLKEGFHEDKEVNSARGGSESSEQNSNLVIKDKNNRPVMVIDTETESFYILEKDEGENIIPRRIDAKAMNVAETEKYINSNSEDKEKKDPKKPDADEQDTDNSEMTIYPEERYRYY